MSGVHRLPLHEVRRRVAQARDRDVLRAWLAQLEPDSRAGAATVARAIRRRLARDRSERLRLAALFALRERLRGRGVRRVAGVDEVGMGPLAGPVVAAAVILAEIVDLPGLDDSKRLAPRQRERLAVRIRDQAVAIGIGEVAPGEVDHLNVYRAGLEAMRRAVHALRPSPDHVLVDARTIPAVDVPQTSLVRGDTRDGTIAAASILAKVHRDAIMEQLDRLHPGYGFARHKGYPTPDHLRALRRLGPSAVHRRSFAPVAAAGLP